MNDYQWEHLKIRDLLEYNLAIVFSLSNDMLTYAGGIWVDSEKLHVLHTLMYVKFNNFIMKACLNRAAVAISLLQTASLTFGTPKLSLSGANSIRKFTMQSMSNIDVIQDAFIILNNKGASFLNEQLFHMIFKTEYHSEVIELKKSSKNFKAINRIKDIEFMKNNNL